MPDRRLCPQSPHERGDAFGIHRVCEPPVPLERRAHDEAVRDGEEVGQVLQRHPAAQKDLGAGAGAADALNIGQVRVRPWLQ